MSKVQAFLSDSGFDVSHDNSGSSSIGRLVCIDELTFYVYCKPLKSSYHKVSKGNEAKLVEIINDNKINTVKFISKDYEKEYTNIDCAILSKTPSSRKNTNGKCIKADVILRDTSGNDFPISIKMDKGSHWESADTIMKPLLERMIKKIVDKHNIEDWNYKNLTKDLIIRTKQNMKKFVFGDDIEEGNGCIVISSFDRVIVNDNHATVYCTEVFDSWEQVKEHPVYKPEVVVIKNCMRNKNSKYTRGLLPMVTTQKRAKSAIKIYDNTPLEKYYGTK